MKKALILFLLILVLVLSLIDNTLIEKFYNYVAALFHLNLKSLEIKIETISDVGHAFAGFCLAIALFRLFRERMVLIIVFLVFFLVGCELLQTLTTTRQANVSDVLRGLSGVAVASVLVGLKNRISKSSLKKAQ